MAVYREVTNRSWGNRLGGSFKGIITGVLLFILGFPVLFWNEGRAVKTYRSLQEGAGIVKTVHSEEILAKNEGALVHVIGVAESQETLSDTAFNISRQTIKLRRNAEMYQWKETSRSTTREKLGGGTETITEYSYDKAWSASHIDSSEFRREGYPNPASMQYAPYTWTAANVSLGAFRLPPSLIARIDAFAPITIESGSTIPSAIAGDARIHDGGYYIGNNPEDPQIGDIRVQFAAVNATEVSIIAKQLQNTFEPYHAKAGASIEMLQVGAHSAENMIQQAIDANKAATWLLRLVGILMMFAGLQMVFRPLSVLTSVVPLIGRIIRAGTGIIAFLISLVFSLLTIGIAWVYYRPVLGVILLTVAAGVIILITGRLKQSKAATPEQPPQ